MLRVLHTSDWHLGHRLYERDRSAEQQLALDWLLELIRRESVDVLIVAGDIFDLGNPPNYAREQYYNFQANLKDTPCRHVVITGGNHDSPSMLNAPAAVFRHFNIHIVGAAQNDRQQQIIELNDEQGRLECVVAAVPFLRDRDLHYSQAGEAVEARAQRLRAGIKAHYQELADLVQPYVASGVPILTTGHLYAHGASTNEKKSNIYIGNQKNIKGTDFPQVFDYVALGHIHRPQLVAKLEHVRYSGSMIPLDFSEVVDDKLVYIVDFKPAQPIDEDGVAKNLNFKVANAKTERKPVEVHSVAIPTFRRLRQFSGALDEVKEKLTNFLARRSVEAPEKLEKLPPWLEVRVQSDHPILQLREQLEAIIGTHRAELLAVKLERSVVKNKELEVPKPDLSDLEVEEVFAQKCKGDGDELPADYPALLDSFLTLRNWEEERNTQ